MTALTAACTSLDILPRNARLREKAPIQLATDKAQHVIAQKDARDVTIDGPLG